MITPSGPKDDLPALIELATFLPGPNRKRAQHAYVYRLKYLNTTAGEAGCVMSWEVHGGRLTYQMAIERQPNGELRCHCTCADSVFRAEAEGRSCKHVLGFLAWSRGQDPGRQMGRAG
jgi:hypothetical protein